MLKSTISQPSRKSSFTETVRTDFSKSRQLQELVHQVIPGGCHTFAKGDDQFPVLAPGFIERGLGSHVWDVDGNEYIEYGMGCRAVTLGHAFPPVVKAVQDELLNGCNFGRPSPLELTCAETLLGMIDGADMCKFAKDGSSVTTAALKLARAVTRRDKIALCGDHPFFAVHDWFIGTTAIDAGIPESVKQLSCKFRYNDIDSLRALFNRHPGEIAAVILEPAKYADPEDGFLHKAQDLCHEQGAVFILDEMITGFRWHNGGAQKYYGIVPDLSTFGKAFANGMSVSALVGKKEIMELGGLTHDKERVFLLSTTHGAETHALAGAIATMQVYQDEPVIETLFARGARLKQGLEEVILENGLERFVSVEGKPCCMVLACCDQEGNASQAFRTLMLQETIKRGLLMPSLVVSYSHSDEDIDATIEAINQSLFVYRKALTEGVEKYLVGKPSKGVYRKFNESGLSNAEKSEAISRQPAAITRFAIDRETIGDELYAMAVRLFPICRSMTGDGVRETLEILRETAPLDVCEVPTGTKVFDWVVPREWNVRDAYVKNNDGQRILDFRQSNLHLVNGSLPVRQSLAWSELKQHLHTLPSQPDRIPYRTCFFKDEWGFCLTQNQFDEFEAAGDQTYEVVIDTTIKDGSLTYGEYCLPGELPDEILFFAHVCHPSLANDNLSGICIAALLAERLSQLPRRRFSYRFLFAPATIGAITWLAQNQGELNRIKHGLVLSLLGDPGHSTYKRSRSGNAKIDQVVEHVLTTSGDPFEVRDFAPYGYDERQFCSPGINLPMGCLMRTPNGEFAEYHTSGDDLQFINTASMADSFDKCLRVLEIFENDDSFVNSYPFCEPRLGNHGLYESLPADANKEQFQRAIQWVLNFSDGEHSLFDIAVRSRMDFPSILGAARQLASCGLIASQD